MLNVVDSFGAEGVTERPENDTMSDQASDGTDIAPALEQPRESLSQRAYCTIRHALITSDLRPGHRLILRPLAQELNLSPTPVREALLRLVSEQALALDERGSAMVPITTREDFLELLEMRAVLEAQAAERAVRFANDAQIEEIVACNAPCMTTYERNEHAAMLHANVSFHRAICRAGRSHLLQRTLEGLWMRLGPVYSLCIDKTLPDMSETGHPHLQLIAALRDRNVLAARAAATNDVQQGDRALRPYLVA